MFNLKNSRLARAVETAWRVVAVIVCLPLLVGLFAEMRRRQ